MDGFLDILLKVGSDPKGWIVVAVLAVWAGVSIYRVLRCPIANARTEISAEAAHRDLNRRIRHPLSYLLLMLAGMGIAVAGLFGLSNGDEASTIPFFMLAAGLFLILTLPVRMRIQESELRVIAATNPDSRSAFARALRHEHYALLQYELGILALFALILVVF